MFRPLLCPSSGAPSNCLCSLWLPYDCRGGRVSNCVRFTGHSWKHFHPDNHTVTRGCLRGFLMMGTIVPETCWAVSARRGNKYKINCTSGWKFRLNIWGCTDPQTLNPSIMFAAGILTRNINETLSVVLAIKYVKREWYSLHALHETYG
jgi:hypothetical protein